MNDTPRGIPDVAAQHFDEHWVPVATRFASRREVFDAGVHQHMQAGVAGTRLAAASIVLPGGYDDDGDLDLPGFGGAFGLAWVQRKD